MKKHILNEGIDLSSRRCFIKKSLGPCLTLPWLESFAESQSSGKQSPKPRVAFLFMPNGVNEHQWAPEKKGQAYELSPILQPLSEVKQEVSVLNHLQHQHAGPPDPHNIGAASFLSGGKVYKTSGQNMRCGQSVDQMIAARWKGFSALPSMELSIARPSASVSNHGYTSLYGGFISWSSDTIPVPRETSPRQAFDRLFLKNVHQGFSPSILDLFQRHTKSIHENVGREDQWRLEEYLTTIRELEKRIERQDQVHSVDLSKYLDTQDQFDDRGDFIENIKLHLELIALAFQSGQTRVASLMMGNATSSFDYSRVLKGCQGSYHAISHHAGSEENLRKYAEINKYHVQLFADLIKKLQSMPEAGASVLDHTLLFFGSSMRDGNSHHHLDLPILLAGGRTMIKQGQFVESPEGTPLCNLYLTMLRVLGVEVDQFGDSTGLIESLLS